MAGNRPFAAHIREDGTVQTVAEHLKGVAERAREFAEPFGAGDMAYQCGLAHDIGKYSEGFQRRIWSGGPKIDHSTAGAREICGLCGWPAAYCVAGHHSGLMDGGGACDSETAGTLKGRLCKNLSDDYKRYGAEVELRRPRPPRLQMLGRGGFSISFFTRMLFSCLVDADFLDTEAFMMGGGAGRGGACGVEALVRKLDAFIGEKHWLDAAEGLNGRRSGILRTCIDAGEESDRGLFTLTVPTGGGKTVSSLAFALHHAKRHGMRRVIYVIPYCSIIEQTADVFSGILGAENVLAHYSGAQDDDGRNEEMSPKRLAAENWELPVVVTTAVQFFESLFSDRTSVCRKLHSIAGSVVIFDEAQTLPLPYLKPCVDAIAELAVNYGASCVLCTATQPALGRFFREYAPALAAKEICRDARALYRDFRRVRYEQLGSLADGELARRLDACGQVLCIVSTKRQAKNVYGLLKSEGSFHLSTLMTPEHRRSVLREIRGRLGGGRPCRVVSTSLIEAGVDVDFPTVYRAYAGLDSEIQAGGRCNRENRRPAQDSVVYLFKPEERYRIPDSMKRPAAEARSATRGREEIDAPEAVTEYFERLYGDSGDAVDREKIVQSFEEGLKSGQSFPFRTAAGRFHIIPDNTWTVLVPRDGRSREIADLLGRPGFVPGRALYREMGQYCVGVYKEQYAALFPSLRPVGEKLAVLAVPELYDGHTGLRFEDDGGYGIYG